MQRKGRIAVTLKVLATIRIHPGTRLADLLDMTGYSRGGMLGLLREARNVFDVSVHGGREGYVITRWGLLNEGAIIDWYEQQ